MGESFKERLAKWQTTTVPLTPEAQERKLREAREKQREAVKVARARATRYNMTLRALSIKTIREQSEMKKKDFAALQEAKENAKKFNMTSRALSIVANKNQKNVAAALDPAISPKIAKEFVEAAAAYQAKTEAVITDPSVSEKQRFSTAAAVLEKMPLAELEEETPEERKRQSTKSTTSSVSEVHEEEADSQESGVDTDDEEAAVVMEDLAVALAQNDQEGINRAILKSFLEEHCPSRLDEVDGLLEQYEGENVDILFQELIKKYPDPAEAIKVGEEKALENALKESEDVEDENKSEAEAEEEEAEAEAQEDEEELSAIEMQKLAEKKEQEKIDNMTEEERMNYFKAKEEEREHSDKKTKMLQDQMAIYSKGGVKSSPVFAAMRTRKSVSKRLSKTIEKKDTAESDRISNPDGFILNAKQVKDSSTNNSKWAVNVQPNLLREKMKKAGVADDDIEELLASDSGML